MEVIEKPDCRTAGKSATIASRVTRLAEAERRARKGWQSANASLLNAAQEYFASLAPSEVEQARQWFAKLLTENQ